MAVLTSTVTDVCEPCPSNGVCHEGKLDCLRGYRKLGKSCVEDGDIDETAKKLAKLIEIRLCEAYAQYLCEGVGTAWVGEEELWNRLDEFKLVERFGLADAKFMHAKERAVETIDKLLETRPTNIGIKELKCPELLVERYKPITCRIRQWIAKHALVLVPICALLLGCTLILFRIRQRHYLSARAEHLYNKVCDILEENALVSRSVKGEGEPWVVASWLRDDLLLPRERRDPSLWKKVEELVQEDSRLDQYPKMVKGELKVVWEWQVEGSLSALAKRKKGEESKQKLNESTSTSSIQQRLASKDSEALKC
ncbi:hypothetical protein RJ640_016963 [Escallonia rubra]|uniref:Man1/Src1-like C-terminal domain-containing protein n=1 Tax=Escallonia rubra TaxID=112253 RepID=A0AA88RF78_9ASTE|nr:hypothetical protein RJ640_016963 [Escallonia rubra]